MSTAQITNSTKSKKSPTKTKNPKDFYFPNKSNSENNENFENQPQPQQQQEPEPEPESLPELNPDAAYYQNRAEFELLFQQLQNLMSQHKCSIVSQKSKIFGKRKIFHPREGMMLIRAWPSDLTANQRKKVLEPVFEIGFNKQTYNRMLYGGLSSDDYIDVHYGPAGIGHCKIFKTGRIWFDGDEEIEYFH